MGKFAFTLFVALFLPTIATADIVTRYDFARNVGSEPSESANLTAPNVTATPLTRGSGLVAASGGEKDMNSFASKGWAGPGTDDFLSLTITPLSGYLVQLDSVMMGVVGSRADRTLVLRSQPRQLPGESRRGVLFDNGRQSDDVVCNAVVVLRPRHLSIRHTRRDQ